MTTRRPDSPPPGSAPDAWAPTRAQSMLATQIMGNDEEEQAAPGRDIGRLVGTDQRELFVSCGPAEAMLQQFDVLRPEFVVLHDVGCAISRRLLASIAGAANQRVQRLVIRRQGYGTPLATLHYIEWTAPRQPGAVPTVTLRLYTTEVEADAAVRGPMAQALLARSRLGAIFVGDLSPEQLAQQLQPLREAIAGRDWLNRQLLMMPLAAGNALAGASDLGRSGTVAVRVTPHVARPVEAWGYLGSTWNRLREQLGAEGRHLPLLTSATAAAPAAPAAPAARTSAATAVAAPTAGPRPGSAGAGSGIGPAAATSAGSSTGAGIGPGAIGPGHVTQRTPAPTRPGTSGMAAADPAAAAPGAAAPSWAPTAPLPLAPSAPPVPPAPQRAETPTLPLSLEGVTLRPMPEVPRGGPRSVSLEQEVGDYLGQVSKVSGVVATCIFDAATSAPLAVTGDEHPAETMGTEGHALLDAMSQAAESLGMALGLPEMMITLDAWHLLLRPMPSHPRLMLLLVADKAVNPALLRLQIQRLDES